MFKLHHIALSVKNLETSIQFYSFFGFKKVLYWEAQDKSLKITQLKLDEIFLELFCYPSPQPLPESAKKLETDLPEIGIKHFGLKVESIVQTRKLLIKKGFISDVEIIKGRTGVDYFFIKDPNGILLEISEDNRNL